MSSSEQPPISPGSSIQETDEARDKRLKQLERVAAEIVSTEQTYADSLSALKSGFIAKLKQSPFDTDESVQDFLKFAGKIEAIENISQKMLTELRDAEEQPDVEQRAIAISKILSKYTPIMKVVYSDYVAAQEDITRTDISLCEKNKKYKQLSREFQDEPHNKGQTVSSIFIMPVQRIPRYKLLTTELERCVGSLNKETVRKVKEDFDSAAQSINEAVRAREGRERLLAGDKEFLRSLKSFGKEGKTARRVEFSIDKDKQILANKKSMKQTIEDVFKNLGETLKEHVHKIEKPMFGKERHYIQASIGVPPKICEFLVQYENEKIVIEVKGDIKKQGKVVKLEDLSPWERKELFEHAKQAGQEICKQIGMKNPPDPQSKYPLEKGTAQRQAKSSGKSAVTTETARVADSTVSPPTAVPLAAFPPLMPKTERPSLQSPRPISASVTGSVSGGSGVTAPPKKPPQPLSKQPPMKPPLPDKPRPKLLFLASSTSHSSSHQASTVLPLKLSQVNILQELYTESIREIIKAINQEAMSQKSTKEGMKIRELLEAYPKPEEVTDQHKQVLKDAINEFEATRVKMGAITPSNDKPQDPPSHNSPPH